VGKTNGRIPEKKFPQECIVSGIIKKQTEFQTPCIGVEQVKPEPPLFLFLASGSGW